MSAPKLFIGDKVRIKKYSDLFGFDDPIMDFHMRSAAFRVTGIYRAICGSEKEGWFDDIEMVDIKTGENLPYMILNSNLEKIG